MSERTYDLAGFNPAQPRTAGGMWGSGGSATQQQTQKNKALLKQRAALRAQVKHLRAVLDSLSPHHSGKVGTHAGAAGKHAGPKGTKAKAAKKGGSKAKAAAHGHAAGGGSGGGGPSLAAQVHALSSEVLALKRAIARAQARKHRHARR